MEAIGKINTQTNVYLDIENLVEYLFIGWDRILTKEEKQQLVAKFPHQRRIALAKFFENALLDAADNFPQMELKIISQQQAEEAPAPAAASAPPAPEPAPPAAVAPSPAPASVPPATASAPPVADSAPPVADSAPPVAAPAPPAG